MFLVIGVTLRNGFDVCGAVEITALKIGKAHYPMEDESCLATDRLRLSLQVFSLELSSDIIKRALQPLAYFIDFIALDN
jgi:hypothetical protein